MVSEEAAGSRSGDAASLDFNRVTQVFDKRGDKLVALLEVSLKARRGEFISLVGPSGCGKSTMLKIIGGLLTPTAGTVHLGGRRITEPRPEIGLMFQTSTLFPWRNVIRNITLPLEIAREDGDWEQRVAEVIDLVQLNGFENHYPRELSGGMQQRVALSRLLISDPELMLLDEPFGSLDEFTREHLNAELARIVEHAGKTTIFVTHNIPEAVFLSDRVAVMGTTPGRILEMLDVDLPRPRVPASRLHREYAETVYRIREILGLH